MASPSRLKAALRRLEARRVELERQIVAEMDARYFSDVTPTITEIVTSHPIVRAPNATIGGPETSTAPNTHFTVTWFAA